MVKKKSMENSKEKYILADDSKFSQVSSIKFADFEDAVIVTNALSNDNYKKYKNIKEV
jgi:transcriptional regulators of sugar metabolism